jgi:hydroxymethylpyrimidine/phosphomethylpyrimidine kinase
MTMSSTPALTTDPPEADRTSRPPPPCVMSFNASDPSGAGGLAGDVATIAAMGAHALPVVTSS